MLRNEKVGKLMEVMSGSLAQPVRELQATNSEILESMIRCSASFAHHIKLSKTAGQLEGMAEKIEEVRNFFEEATRDNE